MELNTQGYCVLRPKLSRCDFLPSKEKVVPYLFITDSPGYLQLALEAGHKPYGALINFNEPLSSFFENFSLLLSKFHENGGKEIIFACYKDVFDWEFQARFVYQFFQLLQGKHFNLLLLSESPNGFLSLLEGVGLSLEQEEGKLKCLRLQADKDCYPRLGDYFSTALKKGFRFYSVIDNQLFCESWEEASFPVQPKPSAFLKGRVVMIGGSGGVGQAVVKHLASLDCEVFVIGRRVLTDKLANSLKLAGAKAYFQANGSNASEMLSVCKYIVSNYGDIDHFFHLGGIVKDGLFSKKTLDTFLEVLAPKVGGALVLESLAKKFEPKTITFFSSLSAILGNVGQSDYAAANAFLNETVKKNNQALSNTRWFTINWGLWETETGMQMEANAQLQAMTPDKATAALSKLHADSIPVSIVYQGKFELLAPRWQVVHSGSIDEELEKIDYEALLDWVKNIVIKCTKFRHLGADDSLLAMGVDSVIATHIASHIESTLSKVDSTVSITKTLLFQYASISEIAGYLEENYPHILQKLLPSKKKSIEYLSESRLESSDSLKQKNDSGAIAVIAMAGEFPDADDLLAFWKLLEEGHSAIKPIPKDRWDWRKDFIADHKNQLGKSYCRHGAFIRRPTEFDNQYFNIVPRDAIKIDPQARRLLHQSVYALEQCDFLKKANGDVGVFTAAMYGHYQNLNAENELIDSSFSALSNHISYAFNFKGPSLCVDTMCSGGLTALHLAVNSLLLSECQSALVGGVNIMTHPGKYRFLSEGRFLSPTGKCHSFGASADGYVPGEGVVVLVLKPLARALEDRDKIFGIILGSAINSNGRGSGMTVPSVSAQANVIKKALDKSGVGLEAISYIEAHGTGTELGDPIEIEALKKVYGKSEKKISISALKSNIGHLEAASGLAGVVKTLLQMHFRTKVKSLNCELENPYLNLESSPFYLQKKISSWEGESNGSLYAGVSGFGAGGSNAHIILESAPKENQWDMIPTPKHEFNSNVFLADLISEQQSRMREIQNKMVQPIEKILLTPNFILSQSPFFRKTDEKTIYLCTSFQFNELKDLIKGNNNHLITIENVPKIEEFIKNKTNEGLRLVNLSLLDKVTAGEENYREQFNLAKLLTQVNSNIKYLHIHPLDVTVTSDLLRKSYVALYHTLSLEQPHITVNVIETDASLDYLVTSICQREATSLKSFTYYRYHQDRWYLKQYEECEDFTTFSRKPLLKVGGVYLVSGGLGAIGQLICKYMLSIYQAKIICFGRSALEGEKAEQFQRLYEISPTIEYFQVDITESRAVFELVNQVMNNHGKINGLIHSACVLRDSLLKEKDWEDFNEVIQSKTLGTKNLDQATENIDLDFFVIFSSMSSVFGNVGQADYCVGNMFVDLFSNWRDGLVRQHLRKGKTIAINWPIWEVEGLSIDASTVDFICEATGINPIKADEGVLLFDGLLDFQTPSQIVPLCGDPFQIRKKVLDSSEDKEKPSIQSQDVLDTIRDLVSEVTKMSKELLNEQTHINELGMSSVLLTELASKIEQKLDVSIAPSAFFTYTDLGKISNYLMKKAFPEPSASIRQAQETLNSKEEDYAIIGLNCLLPGGPDPEAFWQSLLDNCSAIKKVSRWPDKDYYAGTLPDIECFDNKFFKLSNRESMLMDPQHRLFLQVAYNAFLDAAYPPEQLDNVGVFVGVQFSDYQNLLQELKNDHHPYAATGNSHSMLANRVSYLFDFSGPSQTIDTACSSTLVAINRGLLALKNQECDVALVGGVSLLIDPNVMESAQSMGILSPRYRSATFDEQADGYVRGEGVGAFVIKRLSDAIRDCDAIHAIIKSFSENHGGRATSLTAPNPIAQKKLLIKAYSDNLAKQVSYIETHGTGTKLGDPIEIDALMLAFNELNPNAKRGSINLGAVKTNVGHLEPAAGVASLVKVIYALKNRIIPANINFSKLNSYINLNDSPFKLVNKNQTWESEELRVAGISSFGFGGSNAHLVLMEAKIREEAPADQDQAFYYFTLSAKSPDALEAMKKQLATFLKRNGRLSLLSLSYTLNCCRNHYTHRFACSANTIEMLIQALKKNEPVEVLDENLVVYLEGKGVDWRVFYPNGILKVHLPGYFFEGKPYWFDTKVTLIEKEESSVA